MYGFIHTPLTDIEVNFKRDGVPIDVEKRPWLKQISADFVVLDKHEKPHTSGDVSLYYYIRWKYPDIPLVLMNPHTTSLHDMDAHALNFYVTYNRGEAYTFDNHDQYVHACRLLSHDSILMPKGWQAIVDNKNNMYQYLTQHGIDVLPWLYFQNGKETMSTMRTKIMQFMQEQGIQSVVVRPEYGSCTESVEMLSWEDVMGGDLYSLVRVLSSFPGVFITPFVSDFVDKGEYKVMFIGGKPYGVFKLIQALDDSNDDPTITYISPSHPDVRVYVEYAEKVFATLPKLYICGKEWPIYYTRIDLVCCWKGQMFVNEIEAVPSLLPECFEKYDYHMYVERALGDELAEVMNCHRESQRKGVHTVLLSILTFIIVYAVVAGLLAWKK